MYLRKKTFFVLRSAAAASPPPLFFGKKILKKKEKEKKIWVLHRVFWTGFWVGGCTHVLPYNQHASYRRFRYNIQRNLPKRYTISQRKNQLLFSSFCSQSVFYKGRGGEQNERSVFTSAKTQTPISKPLYEPSTVFHFTVHKHTQLGRERRRQRRIRERKERRQKTQSVGRRQALTIFNLKLPHHTSFRPHAHTHRKHRDGQTEN